MLLRISEHWYFVRSVKANRSGWWGRQQAGHQGRRADAAVHPRQNLSLLVGKGGGSSLRLDEMSPSPSFGVSPVLRLGQPPAVETQSLTLRPPGMSWQWTFLRSKATCSSNTASRCSPLPPRPLPWTLPKWTPWSHRQDVCCDVKKIVFLLARRWGAVEAAGLECWATWVGPSGDPQPLAHSDKDPQQVVPSPLPSTVGSFEAPCQGLRRGGSWEGDCLVWWSQDE